MKVFGRDLGLLWERIMSIVGEETRRVSWSGNCFSDMVSASIKSSADQAGEDLIVRSQGAPTIDITDHGLIYGRSEHGESRKHSVKEVSTMGGHLHSQVHIRSELCNSCIIQLSALRVLGLSCESFGVNSAQVNNTLGALFT